MADLIPERTLRVRESVNASFYVRALDEEGHSVRVPMIRFFQERYRGIALTTTNPNLMGASQIGDWFHCGETGRFTNFDNQEASEFDRFYYNGTTWDLLPYSDLWTTNFNYLTLADTDPSAIPTPEVGYVFFGVHDSKPWTKDSNGTIIYSSASVNSQEFIVEHDGEDEFEVSQPMSASSLVFHNGSLLPSSGWSSNEDISDTIILTLTNPAYEGDVVKVLF